MIIKKILLLSIISVFALLVFVVFFWNIPAPTNKIEKNLEIHRLNKNVQD